MYDVGHCLNRRKLQWNVFNIQASMNANILGHIACLQHGRKIPLSSQHGNIGCIYVVLIIFTIKLKRLRIQPSKNNLFCNHSTSDFDNFSIFVSSNSGFKVSEWSCPINLSNSLVVNVPSIIVMIKSHYRFSKSHSFLMILSKF